MKSQPQKINKVCGVILAGGKGSRMGGGEKPLQILQGRTLIDHVIALARPQVDELILSTNSAPATYSHLQLPIVADYDRAHAGPLIGIASAMALLSSRQNQDEIDIETLPLLACFAADVPFFPTSLVMQLKQSLENSNKQVAIACQGKQLQPLFSLWNIATLPILEQAIATGLYGPKPLLPQLDAVLVDIATNSAFDFANLNTRQELQELELKLQSELST